MNFRIPRTEIQLPDGSAGMIQQPDRLRRDWDKGGIDAAIANFLIERPTLPTVAGSLRFTSEAHARFLWNDDAEKQNAVVEALARWILEHGAREGISLEADGDGSRVVIDTREPGLSEDEQISEIIRSSGVGRFLIGGLVKTVGRVTWAKFSTPGGEVFQIEVTSSVDLSTTEEIGKTIITKAASRLGLE